MKNLVFLILLIALPVFSFGQVKSDSVSEKLKLSAVGFPVKPFTDTLFFIYTKVGSFSASDRAKAITEKIQRLYDDYEFQPDSLTINKTETNVEIVYHDLVVMSINEADALPFTKSRQELAVEYKDKISKSIADARKENSILNIAIHIGTIVLILASLFVVISLNNKLFKKLNEKIATSNERLLTGIRFNGYPLLSRKRQLHLIQGLLNVMKYLVVVVVFYLAIPLLFSVFPWTRGFAEILLGWIVTPLKHILDSLVGYVPNFFTIVVIAIVTHYAIKLLKFIADEIESGAITLPGFYPDWANTTFNVVRFLLYAFSFTVIFRYLPGSDSPIFRGVSVFLGVLFSFGSTSATANTIAGLVITYMRPFKIGDRVKIGEFSGDVIEKSLLVTRIRTIKNEEISIPNAEILSHHTINYTTASHDLGLILHADVTIGYDVHWKQVHQLLIEAALLTNEIVKEERRRPYVFQTSLDDFYVRYQINAYTNQSHKMASIYSELYQNILDKFHGAGIEMVSPHYQVEREVIKTTIPELVKQG